MDNKYLKLISASSKWAFITELIAKIVTPITNLVLARILAPEAFGIVATIQMIVSFADMLADAGFQKFIIQKEFDSNEEKDNTILVALYTNLTLAVIIMFILVVFSDDVATLCGDMGLNRVISISSINIPLVAFAGIQMAVMRREFEFKKILLIRLIYVSTPLMITLPLALWGLGYWSLICGYICAHTFQDLAILKFGTIKLRLYYSIHCLKKMFAFSVWTLFESVFIWFTSWCDVFLVVNGLSKHHIGIYKMSMTSVQAFLGIITGAIIPVLYSVLSRLQDNDTAFFETFHYMQKRIAIFVIPLGVGLFCYKDLARKILFGEQWYEADLMIGLWGLTSCILVVYGHMCSEIYRAKGRPILSTIAQVAHLIVLIPTILAFSYSFADLVIARNLIRLQGILVHFGLIFWVLKFNPIDMILNTWRYIVASCFMWISIVVLKSVFDNVYFEWFSMLLAIVSYFGILAFFKEERKLITTMLKKRSLF